MGFDYKISDDVLPEDLPSHEDYNLKPYDPDAEEEQEEEETDDEFGEKPEGESSDDDSSNSSSDDENPKEKASSSALARSAVSVHLNKSNAGSNISMEDKNSGDQDDQNSNNPNAQTNNRPKSTEGDQKGWWKPLFGKKGSTKRKEPVQSNNAVEGEVAEEESESSSESEIEEDAPPKRCLTPHGGSASEYDSSEDSDND